jgi:hypothetical protein
MARFLDTHGMHAEIAALIEEARERVVLVSPLLRVNSRLRTLLENKGETLVRIVYSQTQLDADELRWLSERSNLRMHVCDELHAKCYLSEARCVLGSLNLHKFGVESKDEMGVLLSRSEDAALYFAAGREVERLLVRSQEIRLVMATPETAVPFPTHA